MKARFLKYWVTVVIAITSAFGVQLLLLSKNAHMSYELGALRVREERLKAERNLLALEAASLRQVDRIETIARGSFGMEVPKHGQVVMMGRAPEPQHAQVLSAGSGR